MRVKANLNFAIFPQSQLWQYPPMSLQKAASENEDDKCFFPCKAGLNLKQNIKSKRFNISLPIPVSTESPEKINIWIEDDNIYDNLSSAFHMHFHCVLYFELVLLSEICNNYIHINFEFWTQDLRIIKSTQAFKKRAASLLIYLGQARQCLDSFPFSFSSLSKKDWGLYLFPQNFAWRWTWGHLNSYQNSSYYQAWKTFPNFLFESLSLGEL